jgi:hypothetical protein
MNGFDFALPDDIPVSEAIFNLVAGALDRTPSEKRLVFLAKLVLLLGDERGDAKGFSELITIAERDL